MANEQNLGVFFPTAGTDVSCEYGRQPADTTPLAQNVRAFDALVERKRGGSRSGLSKFLDNTVNGVSVIQHLTLLVDPTVAALAPSAFNDDPDSIDDPSGPSGGVDRKFLQNPDGTPSTTVRKVRAGGSANRHRTDPGDRPSPPPSSITIADVAGTIAASSGPDPISSSFGSAPPAGRVVIAWVVTRSIVTGITSTVENGSGSSYTRIGGYVRELYLSGSDTVQYSGSLWKFVTTGSASDQSLVLTPSDSCDRRFIAIEFTGVDTVSPVFDTKPAFESSPDPAFVSTPAVSVAGPGSYVFGIFDVNAATGTTTVVGALNGFDQPFFDPGLTETYVVKSGVSTAQTPACGVVYDVSDTLTSWAGIGFSLKKA